MPLKRLSTHHGMRHYAANKINLNTSDAHFLSPMVCVCVCRLFLSTVNICLYTHTHLLVCTIQIMCEYQIPNDKWQAHKSLHSHTHKNNYRATARANKSTKLHHISTTKLNSANLICDLIYDRISMEHTRSLTLTHTHRHLFAPTAFLPIQTLLFAIFMH